MSKYLVSINRNIREMFEVEAETEEEAENIAVERWSEVEPDDVQYGEIDNVNVEKMEV